MIIRRKVGVAPGTTTIALGDSKCESCIPPMHPIQAGPMIPGAPSNWHEPGLGPASGAVSGPMNLYASEAELRGVRGGLGMIPVPYGYMPGTPSGEVVGVYGDAYGRRGCDPQHYEHGEEGHYYDTQLGRAMPTDAQLATDWNFTPVNSQWVPDAGGRMWPLPWMPPNGWDVNAGRSGPQPSPPLGNGDTADSRNFWLGVASVGVSAILAGVGVIGLLRGRK